jgi:small-conductance mechanosensitive channel
LLLIQSLLIVIVTLVVTLWVGRVLENRLMRAETMDMNLRVVLSKLLRVVLIVVGVLSSLSFVGFDITLLSVFGGALGVGLGFGLQKIASNYFSGFIILLDRSLHLGDVLTVDGHYGVAHQLRARYLVLRKLDGTEVVIPNDTLITSTVINHSLSDRRAQVQVAVQVSYDSPLEAAMKVMREAPLEANRVLKNPAPDVNVKGLTDCGVTLELTVWVEDPEAGFGSLHSFLYLKILEGFRANGVSIPAPQREVRLTNVSPKQ